MSKLTNKQIEAFVNRLGESDLNYIMFVAPKNDDDPGIVAANGKPIELMELMAGAMAEDKVIEDMIVHLAIFFSIDKVKRKLEIAEARAKGNIN